MSDDTDDDVPSGKSYSRRKSKRRIMSSESSSSNNSSPILRTTKKPKCRVVLDDSDSENSDSLLRYTRRRKKVALITSDSEDDSETSESIIVKKSKKVANIIESDDEDSQWETDVSDEEDKDTVAPKQKVSHDEDSNSSQQSEECPICLLPIRSQELGAPESCDHLFCLACILEWSKNVNTCPIDRQEYRWVIAKKKNGGVLRKIPIEKPVPPDEPQLDPICCEICGLGDREDRLLLCDGCDLGFHLECLTPPLYEVPWGSWYCNVCRPSDDDNSFLGFQMPNEEFARIARDDRRRNARLIPRTGQTERLIYRILNHRSNVGQSEQPSSSSASSRRPHRRRTVSKRRKKATKSKTRMVYELDEVTGEVISKKKQIRVRRRRRKTRRNQSKPAKTAKKRLAQQLGMCSAKTPNQAIPEVRAPCNGAVNLNHQRHQAGIPTLHLFGNRDELDYFSGSEEEIGGPDYLVRRRANHSDVAAFRRAARRKGVFLPPVTAQPSVADLLGSILNSQSRFFSKNSKLSVDGSGNLKVENGKKPDLKNFDGLAKETPYHRGNGRRTNQPYQNPPYQGNSYYPYDSYRPSSTSENYRSYHSNSQTNTAGGYDQDMPQDYTQSTLSSYDRDLDPENSQRNEQDEDSDIDIYSDIEESVSTSKMDEDGSAMKPVNLSPSAAAPPAPNNGSDADNNDSENEMVIDTEKVETPVQDEEEEAKEEAAVSSSEDSVAKANTSSETPVGLHSTCEPVQSSFSRPRDEEDDEDEDGCPNFNIYSTESINLAKNTDISLNPDQNNQVVSSTPLPEPPKPPPDLTGDFDTDYAYDPEVIYDPEAAYNSEESEPPAEDVYDPETVYGTPEDTCETIELPKADKKEDQEVGDVPEETAPCDTPEDAAEQPKDGETSMFKRVKSKNPNALYSDSEDEEVVKISQNSFIVGDISTMTEDVSEEERSYTPCLDEKATENGEKNNDDLGTEMISDDEKNDFDESHEHKTASEGDALEINAKESEMDMIRPEDYEEGEIVDKNKAQKEKQEETAKENENKDNPQPDKEEEKNKTKKKEEKKSEPKEKQESFKKLSKSNKERNYRDKEKSGPQGREDKSRNKESTKEKRKRKEIERYDVRALIAEKPRRLKDEFGRDIRKSSSRSRSRSYTPKNSPERRTPPKRRMQSGSRDKKRKKRSRSRKRSSESRSKSRERRRSMSRRRRSRSRSKRKKKSKDRSKRRKRERSTSRTYTPTRKRRKEWEERYSRERGGYSPNAKWTPSLSRSPEPDQARRMSPSWTPPRTLESAAVDPRGLTVILQNDQNQKKKDKKKKGGKKTKETEKRTKRRKKDQTPPPSKEVFASGDNILVSVSFNKENERRDRDVYTKKKKEAEDKEKKKRSLRRKKKNQELSTIKPVAIIDLERSPFRELTPSPKDIIVLSDEDQVDNGAADAQDVCDSSQQVASPENVYMTGPKTPPEPQVKFSIPSKQPTLRPLTSNPLHDPEDDIAEEQEEAMHEMNESAHKGPNTPPEPPNSPPSSPDAYDPFEPTKSRSASPERHAETAPAEDEKRSSIGDGSAEKSAVVPSLTPPQADIQPADSQSSLLISRDSSKSPEQSRTLQTAQTANALTSTPMAANPPRINILSSTILGNVSSTIPQRPAISPVKISPIKAAKGGKQNGGGVEPNDVISLDFDSPYSPGSSDYEDLFEPPPEVVTKKTLNKSAPPIAAAKEPPISSSKASKSAFDNLFDTPVNKLKKVGVSYDKSKGKKSKGTKVVGVKLDEDHLKILDELPNSAVEMQVKDKFLKKLNRQERVVEEVKLVLKPYYNKKKIDKEEYKDIMRRAVPKICHNRSGEINPTRIKNLIEAYVKKIRHSKPKVTSSSSYNPLKG